MATIPLSSSFFPLFLLLFLWPSFVHVRGDYYDNDTVIFQKEIVVEWNKSQINSSPMEIRSSIIVLNEYIIMFKKYMSHSEHELILKRLIGNSGWELIVRKNPAWTLPSDFSLIKLLNNSREFIDKFISILTKCDEIRYVVPEKKFFGSLNDFDVHIQEEEINYEINLMGRRQTKFSEEESHPIHSGFRKLNAHFQVTELLNAQLLWEKGYTGTGVKVGVFDTGLRLNHPHFKKVVEITNWTDENSKEDGLGHGTFVTGVIASQSECLGFAPDSDLYIFRVFTNNRVSYTSWFLDAFNYAIHSEINILNLSIGGPDFLDRPFVEKVWELSANNIIVVSAIGNDGPLYGTLNNPADQLDVIGVGGIDFGEKLAPFSSRGMTTWELPGGYGRVKPDILAYGQNVQGSRIYGGCRALSGTSVASPVVAGAVTLLASSIPENKRRDIVNPASMKQVLVESAERLPDSNIFEQGFGKLNILSAYEILSVYTPRASAIPGSLDLTRCPYFWPYCSQPLYYGGMPIIINTTILNGMGVLGEIVSEPIWKPGNNGEMLELSFTYPEVLWPWTGWLGIHVRVHPSAASWKGEVEGIVELQVVSPPGLGEAEIRHSTIQIPLKAQIIPTPPRNKRLLWDQYHNLRYPSGYFPRDALDIKDEPFDWNGDHIHTNFKGLYHVLRKMGYFIEVLGVPATCFDATQYMALLIVDSEEEFFPVEIKKLRRDVEVHGLSLIVVADWYNVDVMMKIKFFDDNTHQWWTPATGGANIPSLNDLLDVFGIAFGDKIYHGDFDIDNGEESALFGSGVSIAKFPEGGSIASFYLSDKTEEILNGKVEKDLVPVLGFFPTKEFGFQNTTGRIAVFGDSSCLDDTHKRTPCYWLLQSVLKFAEQGIVDSRLPFGKPLEEPFMSKVTNKPLRMEGNDLHKFSKVIGQSVICNRMDFKRYNKTQGEVLELSWEEHPIHNTPRNGVFRGGSSVRYLDHRRALNGIKMYIWPYFLGGIFVLFVLWYLHHTFNKKQNISGKRSQPV